ncbi:MAG: 30S ribosome-binding factor RbfA [Alistipes sp.]|nr:30S ribosome-binding factor RbfA [Candidatus Alistipes equi]
MENTRQQKIAKQIQKDIAEILLKEYREALLGVLVTVTTVRMSVDLSYAKVYISIFPYEKSKAVLEKISGESRTIRGLLGKRMRNQVKSIPELQFFLDDSLEYIENIEGLLNK